MGLDKKCKKKVNEWHAGIKLEMFQRVLALQFLPRQIFINVLDQRL
jgi:nicotinamide mononucleotide adenylyltransferase